MILYSTRRADGIIAPVAKTAPTLPWHATFSRLSPHRFMQFQSQWREICRRGRDTGGERLKNRKKVQKFAVGHKCPNYLVAGIRSTRRLYGRRHRNLSGRRNLRDGRANERPRHPLFVPSLSEFAFRRTKLSPFSPPAPCKPSSLFPLSPCVGQTNSAHLGFPERTVDVWQSVGKFSTTQSSFEKIFDCAQKLSILVNQNKKN